MTPWTVAHVSPLSMEFSRQEYWSEQPFPSPGDLPDSGIKPGSPALQADSVLSESPGKSWTAREVCLDFLSPRPPTFIFVLKQLDLERMELCDFFNEEGKVLGDWRRTH